MRLMRYTDYSLRLLMFVALKPEGLATIQEAADAYGISRAHLMKVAYDLGRHGFLETIRGRNGGLRLGRTPEMIGLGDVVRAMEGDFAPVECLEPGSTGCAIVRNCRLRNVLAEASRAFLAVLDRYTLEDLTRRQPGLARILFAA